LTHLRAATSGNNTQAAKAAALASLTKLRETQTRAIEMKSQNYVPLAEVAELAEKIAVLMRSKMLDFPAKLRRRIEDENPMTLRNAVKLEESIDSAVDDLMRELLTANTDGWGEVLHS
jgi:hypothetical protein